MKKFLNSLTGEWVTPAEWQSALKVGDYYAIHPARIVLGKQYFPMPSVYGRITSNKGMEPGYFLVKAYSQLMPEGDVGEICICDPTHLLTKEHFKQAKQAGWPELLEIIRVED